MMRSMRGLALPALAAAVLGLGGCVVQDDTDDKDAQDAAASAQQQPAGQAAGTQPPQPAPTPPPPPPADVPALDDAQVGVAKSLREQTEAHRAVPLCASCHVKMDPLGFALENYDAIGQWRNEDGKLPLDVSGTLPSGTGHLPAGSPSSPGSGDAVGGMWWPASTPVCRLSQRIPASSFGGRVLGKFVRTIYPGALVSLAAAIPDRLRPAGA